MRRTMLHPLTALATFLLLTAGCDSKLPAPNSVKAPMPKSDQLSADDIDRCTTAGLLPRVVHREYFDIPEGANVTADLTRFGFVRLLGNDLITFLTHTDGKLTRNVHQHHLDQLKLSLEEANQIALGNLQKIAFDGSTIQQCLTKTDTGNDWAVWLGNEFTSSCILLPEFYPGAKKHLHADTFLVRVASTRMVVVLQHKSRDLLPQFDRYIDDVLAESKNLVSENWLILTEKSLTPLPDK